MSRLPSLDRQREGGGREGGSLLLIYSIINMITSNRIYFNRSSPVTTETASQQLMLWLGGSSKQTYKQDMRSEIDIDQGDIY